MPVQVVDEKKLNREGVRVVVLMRRVAVGRTAGGFDQAIGVRNMQEGVAQAQDEQETASRHIRSEVAGRWWQGGAGGGAGGLEEWMGQTVEDTKWRREAKGSGGQWNKQQ